jgi:acyl carrier protein
LAALPAGNEIITTRSIIMADELKDIILKYVTAEYLEEGADPLAYDSPLISGGIVDSFSMVSLKRFLENKYKISIPDDQATPQAFDTVNKIADLVLRFTKA